MRYKATHVSVIDGSDAMFVGGTIALVNEDGYTWTDPIDWWRTVEEEAVRLSAENDASCPHHRVSLIYVAPGARWTCDECGARFHPVGMMCVVPPGKGD